MNVVDATAKSPIAGKYLTFVLGAESFGIQVLKIREIIRQTSITSLPQLPSYVRGVINLRGKIIPVVDLRLKFELPQAETTERTCIVVVQATQTSGAKSLMGVVVDDVEEVVNITDADIEETPDFGTTLDTSCLLGMAKIKGKVKTLLDIDKVITGEAIHRANAVAA